MIRRRWLVVAAMAGAALGAAVAWSLALTLEALRFIGTLDRKV